MKLYSYWRSSAAYRVRVALNLKNLDYDSVPVHLVRGEQRGAYRERNPQGLVPALEHDGHIITQSLAIIDYLDHVFPETPLAPVEPLARSRVQALAQIVVADIHPLNNLRVRKYLASELQISKQQQEDWNKHWVEQGFSAIETLLQDSATGDFCHGNSPTLADVCLIPHVYNVRRAEIDMSPYPEIARIDANCLALDAFDRAIPEHQPDAD